MAKKSNQVIVARNTIIAFVTIVAILILGFGTYVSTDLGRPGEISADEDYRVIEDAKPRRPGEPIEVVEYFSYQCIHCKNFDPVLDEWAAAQADDIVVKKLPVAWSPIQTVLGQTYLTLEEAQVLEQNHGRIFRAIHDARRQFLTPEMVADYVDGRGITRDEFLRVFNSPNIRRAMARADAKQRELQISGTPTLVVAGKYVIGMTGGQKRALEVVEHLIAQERATESAG